MTPFWRRTIAMSQLAEFAFLHRRLAMERSTGSALVRVYAPTSEADGWPTARRLVQIVMDDMPFLVTSVTAELTGQGRAIHLVIHPQLHVRRDPMGHLVEVMTDENSSFLPDRIAESWISVEIDRDSGGEAAERVARGVWQVLADVRVAVDDGPAMREQALQAIADLRAHPPKGVEQADVEEALKYLDWLGEERFTFLGYAEYHRPPNGTLDGNDKLAPAPDSGLGLLRPEQPQASRLLRHAATEPADAAPLTVTKSSERSTVHRPLYLDDIAVGVFDVQGRPIGRRQFLGLFTSAAYHESVLRIPMLRRKVAALLERMAFSPTSHSGRDVIEILEIIRVTNCCRCRSMNWNMPSRRFCISRNASGCGFSCVTITAAATSPRSSTYRGTATPQPAACGWSRSSGMRSMQTGSNTPPWCRTQFWPDCTSSSAVSMRHRSPMPTTRSWNDALRTQSVPGVTI